MDHQQFVLTGYFWTDVFAMACWGQSWTATIFLATASRVADNGKNRVHMQLMACGGRLISHINLQAATLPQPRKPVKSLLGPAMLEDAAGCGLRNWGLSVLSA